MVSQQQYYLKQVIVLNEGAWGGPVTVGSYDPVSKTYSVFDTIYARFASDVIVDSGYIYVAADTFLIKYNADTKQRLLTRVVPGVRELAVWKNQLLVSRAEINPLPTYFQVYDKNTFNLLYELPLSERAASIGVLGDTAYVAVNGWGAVGKLALIDLNNQALIAEVDLGQNGLNPENVFVSRLQGRIYTQNNLNWSNASVSVYYPATGAVNNYLLNRPSGCVGSAYYLNNIYYQISGDKHLEVFSTLAFTTWDTLNINKAIYGIGIDSINARIYVGATDYVSWGKAYVYDFYGGLVDSFDVGISPGTFAFDVRKTTGVDNVAINSPSFMVKDLEDGNRIMVLWLESDAKEGMLSIFDGTGRNVLSLPVKGGRPYFIETGHLPAGFYNVVLTGERIYMRRWAKVDGGLKR